MPVSKRCPTSTSTRSSSRARRRHARRTCSCCSHGGGDGPEGQRRQPRAASSSASSRPRRDIGEVHRLLAKRRQYISRSIHNFQRAVTNALGGEGQAARELVDSSERRLPALRRTRTRTCARRSQLLPGALRDTNAALAKVDDVRRPELGPALQAPAAGRPRARAVAASRRGRSCARRRRSSTTSCGRSPRGATPVVKELRPAAADLADATPDLTTSFEVLNTFLNALAYNPPGSDRGLPLLARVAQPHRRTRCSRPGRATARSGAACSYSTATLAALTGARGQRRRQIDDRGLLTQLVNVPDTPQACGRATRPGG